MQGRAGGKVIAAMAVDDGLRRDPENIATATARTNDGHMISGRRPPRFETKNPLLRLRKNQCETVRFDRIKTSKQFHFSKSLALLHPSPRRFFRAASFLFLTKRHTQRPHARHDEYSGETAANGINNQG